MTNKESELNKLQVQNGNLLMQCAFDKASYEELNQSWYKIRNERNKLTSGIFDIKRHCELKRDTVIEDILELLNRLNKEVGIWED